MMPSDLAEHGEVVLLHSEAAARARDAAGQFAGSAAGPVEDPCECAAVLAGALPGELVRAVHRYGSCGAPDNVLLVRGMLSGMAGLEPTPESVTPPALGRDIVSVVHAADPTSGPRVAGLVSGIRPQAHEAVTDIRAYQQWYPALARYSFYTRSLV